LSWAWRYRTGAKINRLDDEKMKKDAAIEDSQNGKETTIVFQRWSFRAAVGKDGTWGYSFPCNEIMMF
jgi:hypothetical protein